MADHSPLPWQVGPYEGHVSTEHGRLVAGCQGYSDNTNPNVRDENNANAALIVHRVNTYNTLLALVNAVLAIEGTPAAHEWTALRRQAQTIQEAP